MSDFKVLAYDWRSDKEIRGVLIEWKGLDWSLCYVDGRWYHIDSGKEIEDALWNKVQEWKRETFADV